MLDELLPALLSYPQVLPRLSKPLLPPQMMPAACHAWVQAAAAGATAATAASLADSGVPLADLANSPAGAPPAASQVRLQVCLELVVARCNAMPTKADLSVYTTEAAIGFVPFRSSPMLFSPPMLLRQVSGAGAAPEGINATSGVALPSSRPQSAR